MLKNLMKGMIVGAAALTLAGTAHAADININLYGASAQHLFWNDMADDFLLSKGCTGVVQDQVDSRQGITKGTCGSDTVYIRYASKASFDGIFAVKGTGGDPDSCGSPYQRKMVNEATCPWDGVGGTNCSGLKCVDIVLGCSDVAGSSFTQESHGQLKGHKGGGYIDRSFSGIDDSGLDTYQPNVVPFGFFAHKTVTKTKCVGPEPKSPTPGAVKAVSTWGYQCYDFNDGYKCVNNLCVGGPNNGNACNDIRDCGVEDGKSADCIGYYQCVNSLCSGGVNVGVACTRANQCPDVTLADTKCERIPLDNVSRLQAVMIFSGQAPNWKFFGDWYPDLGTAACLRHAGSGTHASMDYAVMRSTSNDWGWPLLNTEASRLNPTTNTTDPAVYFNDGSSDEMTCINELPGAIGYADADQLEGSANFQNLFALKYNGVEPRRTKIRNGEYDFYSNQWLYGNPARTAYSAVKTSWVELMVAFAADPDNIPASKTRFWATQSEMRYNKSTDALYPGYFGETEAQLP